MYAKFRTFNIAVFERVSHAQALARSNPNMEVNDVSNFSFEENQICSIAMPRDETTCSMKFHLCKEVV